MKKKGRRRTEDADHRTSFLKSVERTLDVLEFLSKTRSIGITELADIIKIGRSTAHRILSTLENKGFAVQDLETGKYALGHMVFQLAKSVIHMIEPVKYVRPYLKELCEKIGENIAFGVITPAKDRTLVLAEEVADKAVIAKPILFQRFPLHVCPCGKAYLLSLNDKQLKTVLSKDDMVRFTEYT
ncbi:MAG: helix-turn-helix domain-containing protein, partial [Candidatus Omnitrophica bacterium]|nr:helix-turn-helix domain-containing protein [Candidatus Omnitrophota bacterium]